MRKGFFKTAKNFFKNFIKLEFFSFKEIVNFLNYLSQGVTMIKSSEILIKKLQGDDLKKQNKIPLSSKTLCYVLITCTEPNDAGDMHVEMTYEGDKCLASYLIQSAQGMLDP